MIDPYVLLMAAMYIVAALVCLGCIHWDMPILMGSILLAGWFTFCVFLGELFRIPLWDLHLDQFPILLGILSAYLCVGMVYSPFRWQWRQVEMVTKILQLQSRPHHDPLEVQSLTIRMKDDNNRTLQALWVFIWPIDLPFQLGKNFVQKVLRALVRSYTRGTQKARKPLDDMFR